ncbi:MAG: hypothetical protein H6822_19625 [Planctomycetaceae bacterium]|nr:hypothetical protein [Planctomycetaceae bacterium]
MFRYLRREFDEKVGTGASPEFDALLESFLLHVRVLMDFFYGERSGDKADDVIAADFVAGWNASPSEYLVKLRRPLNKLLAHLTLERQKYTADKFLWDTHGIAEELEPTIERFLASLPDETKPWFESRIDFD